MSIYKQAQEFQFTSREIVEDVVLKLRDREFNTYITVLSQIHQDMQDDGADLDAIAEDVTGSSYYAGKILHLIKAIGEDMFISSSFFTVERALRELRHTEAEEAVEPSVSAPGEEYLDAQTILNMSTEDKIAYFNGLTYPEQFRQNAFVIINNIKFIDSEFNFPNVAEGSWGRYNKEMGSTILTLLSMAQGTYEPPIPKEEPEPPKKKRVIKKDDSLSPEEVSSAAAAKETKERLSQPSKLSEEEILEHPALDAESLKEFQQASGNPYIDFTSDPPRFNEDIKSVFGKFVLQLESIFERARQAGQDGGREINALVSEFNDVAYAIKTADGKAYEALKNFRKEFPDSDKKVLDDLQRRFEQESPSAMILRDEHFNSLYYPALYLGSPKTSNLLVDKDYSGLRFEAIKNTRIEESDFDDLRAVIDSETKRKIKRKATDYFNFSKRYRERNLLNRLGISWSRNFKEVIRKVYPQGPNYTLKPCPTCYKWVPWSYSGPAKKRDERYEGFKVRLVSFYTNDPARPKITRELLESRSWPAPPSSLYSREREQAKVIKYQNEGEKSWAEIQGLLASNNPDLHEEGWHRRSGALFHAGGILLTTTDLLIKNMLTECPFDSASSEASFCGASFSPQSSVGPLGGRMSLQPQWNSVEDTSNKRKETKNNANSLAEDAWEDKALFEQARRMQSGGFKFSKVNFACTAHIKEFDDQTSYKHTNIAVSKTGLAGTGEFVYPTKPDGSLDTSIKDGTMMFLVCGAPTSLSSFDRSADSSGFVLKYLQSIRSESINDYKKAVFHLIRSGVDIQDVMGLDESLDRYVEQGISSQASSVQDRIRKLTELIKTSNIKLHRDGVGSEKRSAIGGLTLVCPFGHKFTVEHSLRFAEAHAGIHKKTGIVQQYGKIITQQGLDNLKALIKANHLVKKDHPDLVDYKTKLPYEEWIKHDNGVVFPSKDTTDSPLLTFLIPVDLEGNTEEYAFRRKFSGGRSFIWNPDASNDPAKAHEGFLDPETQKTQSLIVGEGEDEFDVSGKAAIENWNNQDEVVETGYDFTRLPEGPIPGSNPLVNEDGEYNPVAFDEKIESFSRLIKSTLRLVETYTKGIISDAMMSALLTDYDIDISSYGDDIIKPLYPLVTMEDPEGNPISDEGRRMVMGDMRAYMVNAINRKANNLHEWIRSNITSLDADEGFNNQIAAGIISSAIKEFNSMNPDIGFYSDYGEAFFDIDNFDKQADALALRISSANEGLVRELTLQSEGYHEYTKRRVQYTNRIFLVGYAQYLANILPNIYNKYCADPDSFFYIGYSLGIDLSSPEKILGQERDGEWIGGVTEADIENIVTSVEDAVDLSGPFKPVDDGTLDYGYRIDKAWEELQGYLRRARRQVISPRAMELSKNYIISRMSYVSGANAERAAEIKDKISGSFPSRSLLFNGTTEDPETGSIQVTKRRLPYISKEKPFLTQPGVTRVSEWLLKDVEENTTTIFSSKAEALSYVESLKSEGQEGEVYVAGPGARITSQRWRITPDPYWVNPETNFDSSKVQIGMMSAKMTGDKKWPPTPRSMDFVGINLPFDVRSPAAFKSVNKAKHIPIPSYRFVITFDGEPLDITFLFRKAIDDQDFKELSRAEAKILEAYKSFDVLMEQFTQIKAEEIKANPEILTRFRIQEEARLKEQVEPLLRVVDSKPLYVHTKRNFVDPSDPKNPRPWVRVGIEDPMRAYRLIMNPQLRGKSLTPIEQQRLVDFIIRVYNVDALRDIVRTKGGKYANYTSEDLLTSSDLPALSGKMKSEKLVGFDKKPILDSEGNQRLGWAHAQGEYFDIEPGEEDIDSGSYLQYVYQTSQNIDSYLAAGQHPDIHKLITAGITARGEGLTTSSNDSNELAEAMEKEVLKYIRDYTSGDLKDMALDGKKFASKYSNKILLRRSELHRILLSLGRFDFSDVELPNF